MCVIEEHVETKQAWGGRGVEREGVLDVCVRGVSEGCVSGGVLGVC